jgi:hypothetical protein
MPSALPGLGQPPERNTSETSGLTPEEEWPEEIQTALQVPQAHPQLTYATGAGCRCGVHLAQLVGEDPGVWACASLLLGVAPPGFHDERVRRVLDSPDGASFAGLKSRWTTAPRWIRWASLFRAVLHQEASHAARRVTPGVPPTPPPERTSPE